MSEDVEEVVRPLNEEPEVEKVYLQEETKLYRQRTILAYMGTASVDLSSPDLFSSAVIPVESEDGRLLGFAMVERVGSRLMADISIDYATPERLAAETGEGVRFYPRMVGSVQMEKSAFVDVSLRKPRAERLFLEKIVLSPQAPVDPRLPPLGEPFL